ncbi:Wzz/FepE/Etk N-terminal domain-containing protein [Lactiplantibacillus songbeiensis]|uniref:Wzz/FepE/Etk N-terminal domain-containing protein n=1 Tax=Lactiplantibacillus songbeiensis TaxID=2559920 RepID=A0ABW4C2Y9_9LACO|nr:Wzz/FepE/Etk N-terminal domain-containing protein [Lactiplantibacillus songbeiensis]
MNSNFSFLPFFKVLWYRLIWIILFAIIGGGIGYAWLHQTYTPTYTVAANVDIHHTKTSRGSYLDQLNTDVNRLGTVQSEMSDLGIYRIASSTLKQDSSIDYSANKMQKSVSVLGKPSSTILSVSATTDSAKKSSAVVNAIITSYKNKYTKTDKRLVVKQLSKAKASSAVVSKAMYSSYIKNGAIIGAVLAYVVCLLLYFKQRKNKRQSKRGQLKSEK